MAGIDVREQSYFLWGYEIGKCDAPVTSVWNGSQL